MKPRKVDTQWFRDKIEAQGASLRGFAESMRNERYPTYDISRLSRLIKGTREPDVWEAIEIAKAFDVSVTDVLKRFGYRFPK